MFGRKFGEVNNYCPQGYADGDWKNLDCICDGLLPIRNAASHNYSRDARQVRENYKTISIQKQAQLIGRKTE